MEEVLPFGVDLSSKKWLVSTILEFSLLIFLHVRNILSLLVPMYQEILRIFLLLSFGKLGQVIMNDFFSTLLKDDDILLICDFSDQNHGLIFSEMLVPNLTHFTLNLEHFFHIFNLFFRSQKTWFQC